MEPSAGALRKSPGLGESPPFLPERRRGGLLPARPQRTFFFFIDGLGEDYIAASAMPVLNAWGRKGLRRTVKGIMPSVTNANNASVCCACFPAEHGITANFFLDESTGKELYMESADLVPRKRRPSACCRGALIWCFLQKYARRSGRSDWARRQISIVRR
jgi:predicted AlkP superfamily pyrophosphatase or phosphodiesterase